MVVTDFEFHGERERDSPLIRSVRRFLPAGLLICFCRGSAFFPTGLRGEIPVFPESNCERPSQLDLEQLVDRNLVGTIVHACPAGAEISFQVQNEDKKSKKL